MTREMNKLRDDFEDVKLLAQKQKKQLERSDEQWTFVWSSMFAK